ncbi:hypothetical protein CEP54_016331 [Fusarium duplospermum]|uniref:Uncharacterized protein n=1 Tax=Fusarium duplospermum TaxID=1325734 RepID=A0A428NF85_9HYPO|nr:hypothetical protein CEP54_016331 [Fusarium duplospermum]
MFKFGDLPAAPQLHSFQHEALLAQRPGPSSREQARDAEYLGKFVCEYVRI